jgi:hypothetical protein
MDSDDPKTRITELERQLAEAKATAGHEDVRGQRPQDLRQRPRCKRAVDERDRVQQSVSAGLQDRALHTNRASRGAP